MIDKLKNNHGVTLIELLLSVAILAFVVVGFLNLFVYGTSYIAQARQKSNTSISAQSDINTFIYDNIGSDITTNTTTLTIHLISGTTIDVEMTQIDVIKTDGNQTSEITAVKP